MLICQLDSADGTWGHGTWDRDSNSTDIFQAWDQWSQAWERAQGDKKLQDVQDISKCDFLYQYIFPLHGT